MSFSRWFSTRDINPFFTFLFDAVVNLFVLSSLLMMMGFPESIINERIIPGAIVAIVVGNLGYVLLAYRTAKKHGLSEITAIPMGLDLATTVSFTLTVIGPLFWGLKNTLGDEMQAAELTWQIGMAATLWMGLVKWLLSFVANRIARFIPTAALIGVMFGIAGVWLGANSIIGIFEMPLIGISALIIMAFTLIAGHQLPFKLPGAVVAIVFATGLYYLAAATGILGSLGLNYQEPGSIELAMALPIFSPEIVMLLGGQVINYLAIIIPLAILVTATSINVATAAQLSDDNYRSREVIRVDAFATICSSFMGGVIQTTPYLGHTTYKRLGGQLGYSTGVSLLVLVAGFAGIIQSMIALVPQAAIKPILVVVASDIMRLAFQAVSAKHSPAIGLAIIPTILNFAHTKMSTLYEQLTITLQGIGVRAADVVSPIWLNEYLILGVLARGYILTGLIWSSVLVCMIEKQLTKAAVMLAVAAGFAYFGIIHSVLPSSSMYFPWQLDMTQLPAEQPLLPPAIAISYLLAAILVALFAWWQPQDINQQEK